MTVTTLSLLTLPLARAYGVVILIAAVSTLVAPKRLAAALADFQRSPGLSFLGALFAVVMGIVLIMLHSTWTDLPAGVVSLLGWVILIKGIALMAMPDALLNLGNGLMKSEGDTRIWGILALVLAAVYLAIGLGGRADASFVA